MEVSCRKAAEGTKKCWIEHLSSPEAARMSTSWHLDDGRVLVRCLIVRWQAVCLSAVGKYALPQYERHSSWLAIQYMGSTKFAAANKIMQEEPVDRQAMNE
ncbi:expressed unknown protein [Seminavis robusta]|uniref:Uncharacterized protein n=1 Tax=Seminavis robusta TaxID=568900 RepID=A0A9N8EAE2_9STRA|nr:expressed unknown protein [Seminavis robusta]|eukprot:Sro802_g204692.1  (101) ;mRNA; r:35396-35698